MHREFHVPDIGEFEDVEVIEVLVGPGDRVDVEQSLVTLESDKATMELPSPWAGTVVQLHMAVGDKVSEGGLVATLDVAEADVAAEPAVPETSAASEKGTQPGDAEPALVAQSPPPPSAARRPLPAAGPGRPAPARRSHASPSVRRLARELGVDLTRVSGGGRKGRILKEDLQDYVKATLAAPQAGGGLALPAAPQIDFSRFGATELVPLNKIRRTASRNLHRSWVSIPHVTQFDEADVTELEAFRKSKLEEGRQRDVKLTPLSFLVKALGVTLKAFPGFNASLHESGEALVVKKYFHIGFAVDTEHGLVVPVLRDVDRKGLFNLAGELGDLSRKARARKLRPEDMQGACMTISSLGGIGGTAFTPIINAPEVAILWVARAQIKPIYVDEKFQPRLIMPLCLSYDHRVIDGAEAVRFTTRLKTVLSDIRNLVL